MKWEKLGLVCKPNGNWWALTHCFVPTPEVLGDIIRVYFASWDKDWRGRIGFADFDINNPSKLIYQSVDPILDVGEPGTFDSDGICPSQIFYDNGKHLLYYVGFQRTCVDKVNLAFSGLAIENINFDFQKFSNTPILDRCVGEAFIRSSSYIIKEGNTTKFWYTSSETGWADHGKNDVHSWTKYPFYGISLISTENEYVSNFDKPVRCTGLKKDYIAIGRPWVIKEDNVYKMWYSGRSATIAYDLLYAESEDGISWVMADSGMKKSDSGYDSEMVCFGAIVTINGTRYMYYNGNRHGKDGILLAVKVG